MWPFRRKADAPPAEGPRPVPAPVIRHDWAELPPIQRFIGAHPLTAPSDEFGDDLATHQDPSVSTDTMGHQVSADAPPGLVLALARPTTRSDGPAMIPRPRVQRSVAGAVEESGEWDGDEAAPEMTRPTPLPISASAVAARELPMVEPEPAVQRLTSLAPDAQPMPVPPVQRSRAVPPPPNLLSPTDQPFEMPAAPQRLTLGQSRRLGLGAPIKQVPDHSVQRAQDARPILPQRGRETEESGPESLSATPAPMELPLVSRARTDVPSVSDAALAIPRGVAVTERSSPSLAPPPSLPASDEPRLDLPLARRPAPDEPPLGDRPTSAPTAPSVQLSPTTLNESPIDSPIAGPSRVQGFADGDLPARSSVETRPTMSVGDLMALSMPGVLPPSLPLVSEPPSRAMPATSAPPARGAIAPLASARPLKATTTVQRAHAPTMSIPEMVAEDASTLSLPRVATEDGPSLTVPLRGTHDHVSVLQRAREDLRTPTLTLPQRTGESQFSAPEDPHPVGPELPFTKGWEGQRAALPLPLAPLAASRGNSVQRASQAVDDSQAESLESPMESDAPMVQGAWYETRVAVSRLSAGAATNVAVAAPAGPPQSETDMDELAGKLYDRIRSRLKTELLVDRERAGFLTDLH